MARLLIVTVVALAFAVAGGFFFGAMQTNESRLKSDLDMVFIQGGEFLMGSENPEAYPADLEGPVRKVTVNSFSIQPTEVTNAMFQEFVSATNYETDAEKFGWSFVLETFLSPKQNRLATSAVQGTPWWVQVYGASWSHPEGPDSDIKEKPNHPVVHVSFNDASAFCKFHNARLPTEEEWEYAARGGLEQKNYPWGDHRMGENRQHLANIFQGDFPYNNTAADGFKGTAPVGSFPPNEYGLFDVAGNVWEWTDSIFRGHGSTGGDKVCKGGSFMCHRKYCFRYRCAARRGNSPDSSTQNMGFRCASP